MEWGESSREIQRFSVLSTRQTLNLTTRQMQPLYLRLANVERGVVTVICYLLPNVSILVLAATGIMLLGTV